jgi:hypothetical protein
LRAVLDEYADREIARRTTEAQRHREEKGREEKRNR